MARLTVLWSAERERLESARRTELTAHRRRYDSWIERRTAFEVSQRHGNDCIDLLKRRYGACETDAIEQYCELVLSASEYPDSFPQTDSAQKKLYDSTIYRLALRTMHELFEADVDPDPIRGGELVVQAKRYTNTVGVAAVRDLYGAMTAERASKGILVTTATFGHDSYEFAKDKPITLLDGGGLLHLLQRHGVPARIDLRQAKSVASN
jgi:hypothetical protein